MTDIASIKEFFTDEEWDAIYEAMSEFQDHGDEESDLTDSVQLKISKLFLNWIMRTFSPASDLETKQIVWSCFKFGKQLVYKDNAQVHDSVFLSGCFARRYDEDVKIPTFWIFCPKHDIKLLK